MEQKDQSVNDFSTQPKTYDYCKNMNKVHQLALTEHSSVKHV